ncbi:PepSY domain-containing protein [Streptomyces sp. Isolate_45]|uniref:PepSY domain-containing protein n=1 Tax=Streptomyces sp. Isolate_45 TaxID=2950111 RepID=UPI002481E29D|nr:PepSY domain-containing protein [Streptomyces sp. Isolate_45]MDA5285181.1 PepSY domain-containing protein [Streptomyces sp. Isolate_45]
MKRNLYVSAAAAVVLMAGGPVAAASAATADSSRTAPASAVARVDVDAGGAAAAALKHFPGVVESLDQDGAIWHVNVIGKDGVTNAELEVSATGAVTERNKDRDDNAAENARLVGAKITAAAAMKAALAAHPGTVVSVDWDDDNGSAPHWNVEVKAADGKTSNYDVSSTDGKVTVSSDDGGNDNDGNDDN